MPLPRCACAPQHAPLCVSYDELEAAWELYTPVLHELERAQVTARPQACMRCTARLRLQRAAPGGC